MFWLEKVKLDMMPFMFLVVSQHKIVTLSYIVGGMFAGGVPLRWDGSKVVKKWGRSILLMRIEQMTECKVWMRPPTLKK